MWSMCTDCLPWNLGVLSSRPLTELICMYRWCSDTKERAFPWLQDLPALPLCQRPEENVSDLWSYTPWCYRHTLHGHCERCTRDTQRNGRSCWYSTMYPINHPSVPWHLYTVYAYRLLCRLQRFVVGWAFLGLFECFPGYLEGCWIVLQPLDILIMS